MSQPTRATCDLVDARDEYCCARCGRSLYSVLTFSRHHRMMRSHPFPGLHLPGNVIDVCGSGSTGCHGYIHAHPAESYAKGWLVRGNANLLPTDVPILTARHGWILLDDQGHWTPTPSQENNTEGTQCDSQEPIPRKPILRSQTWRMPSD
jgi:hypothetical protein